MKIRQKALSILLTLIMVLTLIPAMAFAEDEETNKIEYKGSTVYIPQGVYDDSDEDYFKGFYEAGNEITVTLGDTTQKLVSKEYNNGAVDYFREGDEAKEENVVYLYYSVKSPGVFTVSYDYMPQGEDYYKTVSTEVKGKCVKSFTYSGPALEYEARGSGDEIYGPDYSEQDGAVITVKYNDETERKAVCRKWGTNTDYEGKTYDEYNYFFEGVTPYVVQDVDGGNYVANNENFYFNWEKAKDGSVPVEYNGVIQNFPASKKVFPKPKKLEFVPAKGFVPTALVGDDYFFTESLYGKGNKFILTWENDKTEEFVYGKYKDSDGERYEGFAYVDEDKNVHGMYPSFDNIKTFKKGVNTITGQAYVWADGYSDDFTLDVKVKVNCTKYVSYVEFKNYTYTGKVIRIKPVVKVANDKGKMVKLAPSKYTFKAPKNKKVGVYTFKVKLKSKADRKKYGSTLTGQYAIAPKAPSNVKLKTGSRRLTVSWDKRSGADGYYVEISRDKKFRDADHRFSETISSKKTKYEFKNLKRGKTYYVRVYSMQMGPHTWIDDNNKKHTVKGEVMSLPAATKKIKIK